MERAVLILLLGMASSVWADGFYFEGGVRYTKDAYYFDGIASRSLGHVAFGYDHSLTGRLVIDANLRHDSDLEHVNDNDWIANESIGVTLRYRLGQ